MKICTALVKPHTKIFSFAKHHARSQFVCGLNVRLFISSNLFILTKLYIWLTTLPEKQGIGWHHFLKIRQFSVLKSDAALVSGLQTRPHHTLPCRIHFFGHCDVQRHSVHSPLLLGQLKLSSLKVGYQIHRLSRVLLHVPPKPVPFLPVGHDIDHAVVRTLDTDGNEDDNQNEDKGSNQSQRDDVLMNITSWNATNSTQTVTWNVDLDRNVTKFSSS